MRSGLVHRCAVAAGSPGDRPGTSLRHARALADWYASFERRFPEPPGWQPVEVRTLPLADYGLRLLDFVEVETRLPMTFDAYLRYVLSETSVNDAIARGAASARAARDWCRETLTPVFAAGDTTVIFPGYIATVVLATAA